MTTRLTGRTLGGGLAGGPAYERIFQSLKGVSLTEPDPLAEFPDPRAVYHDDLQDYASKAHHGRHHLRPPDVGGAPGATVLPG